MLFLTHFLRSLLSHLITNVSDGHGKISFSLHLLSNFGCSKIVRVGHGVGVIVGLVGGKRDWRSQIVSFLGSFTDLALSKYILVGDLIDRVNFRVLEGGEGDSIKVWNDSKGQR